MDHKAKVIESLIEAYDLMMTGMSAQDANESGLFEAWMEQTALAFSAAGMELERQMWETLRQIPVSLDRAKSVTAYGAGMRAVLLGMLHHAESSA
jgi:hypothetical protein